MRFLFTAVVFLLLSTEAFSQIPVHFKVDMNVQIAEERFNPVSDFVVVRGDFQIDAGDAANWSDNFYIIKRETLDFNPLTDWVNTKSSAGDIGG